VGFLSYFVRMPEVLVTWGFATVYRKNNQIYIMHCGTLNVIVILYFF